MNIVIVGGTGFVGSSLSRRLVADGHSVTTVSRGKNASVQLDVHSDPEPLRNVVRDADTLVWLLQPAPQTVARIVERRIIPETANILFASSLIVYPDSPSPQSEDVPPQPITPYEQNKFEEEKLWPAGSCIARIGNVYGNPANRGIIHLAMMAARHGTPLLINGDGSQTRDYIHVDDATRALALLATHPNLRDVGIVNVCTGIGTRISDMIRAVEHATGKRVECRFGPAIPEKRSIIGNNRKLLKLAGDSFIVASLEQGITQTTKTYSDLNA